MKECMSGFTYFGDQEATRETRSSDQRFEPVCQFDQLELARVFGAVKGVTDDDLAQFGRRVDMAEQAVEHVEQPLQVIVGIACRARSEGSEQACAFGRGDLRCLCHRVSPQISRGKEAAAQPVRSHCSSHCQVLYVSLQARNCCRYSLQITSAATFVLSDNLAPGQFARTSVPDVPSY